MYDPMIETTSGSERYVKFGIAMITFAEEVRSVGLESSIV
jgi:hypothetical protein